MFPQNFQPAKEPIQSVQVFGRKVIVYISFDCFSLLSTWYFLLYYIAYVYWFPKSVIMSEFCFVEKCNCCSILQERKWQS
jgi:hypothetical protein